MHLPPLAWQAGDGEDIRLDKDRHATPRRPPSSLPSFQSHRGLVMKLGGRALQMMWSGAGRGEDPRGDEEEEEEEEIGSPSLI